MMRGDVEIVEIEDDGDGVLLLNGSSEKNPISLGDSDDELGIEDLFVFPVGMEEFVEVEVGIEGLKSCYNLRGKRGLDLNVGCVDDEVEIVGESAPVKKRSKCEGSCSGVDHDEVGMDLHTFKCEICVDDKPFHQLFVIKGCNHHYCSECIMRYVSSKLDQSVSQITCPVTGCKGLLDPEDCQEILPTQVFDRWGEALCDSLFPASQKVYCPYKNCSGLLLDDCKRGKRVMKKFGCLHCKRLFCFQCKSPWHEKMKCEEFQKLHKDGLEAEDIMMMKLAKTKKWQRCPECKFYVQRNEGCRHMSCRCGHQFCYGCGATWAQQCDGSCK